MPSTHEDQLRVVTPAPPAMSEEVQSEQMAVEIHAASQYEEGEEHSPAEQSQNLESLHRILKRKDCKPFSAKLLKDTVAWFKGEAPELLSILLRHNTHPIDEEIALIAAKNFRGAEIMATLLNCNKDLVISDSIMLEAAKNDSDITPFVMHTLLQQENHPKVTEELIKAALSQKKSIPSLVELLLENSNELIISDEILTIAAEADHYGAPITQLLLKHQAIPVTQNAIDAGLRNRQWSAVSDVLEALVTRGKQAPVDQQIVDEACTRHMHDPDALKYLERLRDIATSENQTPQHDDTGEHALKESVTQCVRGKQSCATCLNLCASKDSSNCHSKFTVKELHASAEAGCRYCSVMQQALEQTLQSKICPGQEIIVWWSDKGLYPFLIRIFYCDGPDCCPEPVEWWIKDNVAKDIDIYMHPGTRVFSPAIGVACDISSNASTDECMTLANEWVKDCIANHLICPCPSTLLPSRVIKVGCEQIDPMLYVPSGDDRAQYAALSHCWGGLHGITTTIATLEERKQGIPMTSLPKTFRDAIVITRRLGIEYLWVDSLCILQDSTVDWAREAANMAAVYSGAAVVISADAAQNSNDGCFGPYQQGYTRNVSFAIPCVDDQGLDCRVYARRNQRTKHSHELEHICSRDTESHFPALRRRAWALQERLLSARVLHYGFTELAWECWSQSSCECAAAPDKIDYDKENKNYRTTMVGKMALSQQDLADIQNFEVYRLKHWYNLVEEFTQLELSYHSDRLAALSGLAAKLQGPAGEYICGLWRSDFVRGLIWHVTHSDYSIRPSYRQEAYIAPSWSWASVTGTINCLKSQYYDADDLEILDIKYTLASSNPFGAISQACITARGYLFPVWLDDDLCIHYDTDESLNHIDWAEGNKSGRVYLDVTSGERARDEIMVQEPLRLLIMRGYNSLNGFMGIVLRAVKAASAPKTYQRIGYMDSYSARWSHEAVHVGVLCDITDRQVFRWI